MKRILLLLLAGLFSISSYAQTDKTANSSWASMKKEITEQQSFEIEITQVIPRRGKTTHPSNYFLRIQNDSIDSALPYYGRATNIAYGGGEGLNFKAPLKSYEISKIKDKEMTIKLKADSKDDNYEYIITIYANKKVSFDVIGVNRESISFLGTYISLKE